jgi:hypothetical protein
MPINPIIWARTCHIRHAYPPESDNIYKNHLPVSILSQMIPVHILIPYILRPISMPSSYKYQAQQVTSSFLAFSTKIIYIFLV